MGLLFHNGDKKKYIWNTGDLLRHLLVLSRSMIKANRKLQQPNSAGVLITDTYQESIWFTSSTEMLTDSKANMIDSWKKILVNTSANHEANFRIED